eukprot:TRINITY_DN22600_c0_g1_i1.p1 TRINITY_DN22600_c0_g1~~TRINITY_DN22600_c0_g1_i1.p1  ORF type:complete len:444 (-),score=143.03 TRINITY_DN22600_c0_g1_i1:296-1549(-)
MDIEFQSLKDEIRKVCVESGEIKKENDILKSDLKDLNTKYNSLQADFEVSGSATQQLQSENVLLRSQSNEWKKRCGVETQGKEDLEEEMEEKARIIDDLKNQLERAIIQSQQLETEIEECKECGHEKKFELCSCENSWVQRLFEGIDVESEPVTSAFLLKKLEEALKMIKFHESEGTRMNSQYSLQCEENDRMMESLVMLQEKMVDLEEENARLRDATTQSLSNGSMSKAEVLSEWSSSYSSSNGPSNLAAQLISFGARRMGSTGSTPNTMTSYQMRPQQSRSQYQHQHGETPITPATPSSVGSPLSPSPHSPLSKDCSEMVKIHLPPPLFYPQFLSNSITNFATNRQPGMILFDQDRLSKNQGVFSLPNFESSERLTTPWSQMNPSPFFLKSGFLNHFLIPALSVKVSVAACATPK